ncbi:LicD family protein [Pseudobutyrivibrio sp. MD2005]|uniref:LicD family protein n=1 Tax=Pseudobutyrivibrio sp. MD2005 TaxID=1410616 RepID=UPI00047FEB64|nr:LicD family protein [Pseudobutyrivibrio sp. MD2005]
MERAYIRSIIAEFSNKIDRYKEEKIFEGKKIALFELNMFSSAVRTLMANKGIWISYYVFKDSYVAMEQSRYVKSFAARYLNNLDSAIKPILLEEARQVEEIVLITAHKINIEDVNCLQKYGFNEGRNWLNLYDENDEFNDYVKNKEQICLNDLHRLEKNMLKEFDIFCSKNNLRYWVCGGTLLGTIRHKGFIPWDDDIDVFMPYEDYKEFVRLFKSEKYEICSLEKKEYEGKYVDSWGKLLGNQIIMKEDAGPYYKYHTEWIDIFCLVGMPEDEVDRKRFFGRATELKKLQNEYFYSSNGSIKACNKVYEKYVEMFSEYPFETAKYVGALGSEYKERDCTTKEAYAETIRMPFEDIEVNVPVGYKEYLDNLYGPDWMELPPPEKRASHHNLEAYWM